MNCVKSIGQTLRGPICAKNRFFCPLSVYSMSTEDNSVKHMFIEHVFMSMYFLLHINASLMKTLYFLGDFSAFFAFFVFAVYIVRNVLLATFAATFKSEKQNVFFFTLASCF